jgi:hypothetical protein
VIVGTVILKDSCIIRYRIPVIPGALSRYNPLIACLISSIVIGSCTKGSGYSYPSWSDRSGSGGLEKNWYCRACTLSWKVVAILYSIVRSGNCRIGSSI